MNSKIAMGMGSVFLSIGLLYNAADISGNYDLVGSVIIAAAFICSAIEDKQ